jgi:PKD repeat protein
LVLHEWDFQGDGVFDAQGSVVKHSYEKMGVHDAVLRVTDSIGETSVDTIKVTVLNREPLAAFNYTPQEPAFHEVISFLDASIDEDGSIVSWHWDFGDGAKSTDANTSHAYEDKGTYLVTLTVTDEDGGVGEVTVEVPLKNLLPSARYTYSPTDLNAFDEIKFVDRSSDPEEKQLIYFWDFGDGSTSTEKDPIHIFEFSGTMTVSLTVTDDEGASDTFSKSLIVFPKVRPLADFTFSPEEATVGEQLSFLDKSEDDDGYIISWDWDFGDGDTSSKKDTTHKFSEKGTHYVTLKVTDNDGNQDSVTKTVRIINLPPQADFTVSDETVKVGKEVSFIDSSNDPEGEPMSYLWDFGDGSTSNQRNPVHKYEESGQYTVELSVSDDEGATSSKSLAVRVQESGQNWIPGFPIESIAFGLVLGVILVAIISKRSKLISLS